MTSVNNDMIVVKVVRPYKIKGEAVCEKCALTYSKKHYDILYKSDKLLYLDITLNGKTRLICHDCFYKFLKKKAMRSSKEVKVMVHDGHKKFVMTVTPYNDPREGGNDDAFLL